MTSATPKMYEIDKKEATFRPQIMKIVASMAVYPKLAILLHRNI